MELSFHQVEEICLLFDLGKIRRFFYIDAGLSNYNFEIQTSTGTFIARFSTFMADKQGLKRLEMQIRAISHLHSKGFPYDLPIPLKSAHGKFIEYLNNRPFWIYRKIEGKVFHDVRKIEIKQLARLVASFHTHIQDLKIVKGLSTFKDLDLRATRDIKKIKRRLSKKERKDKIDKLLESNLSLIQKVNQCMLLKSFGRKRIFSHSDWWVENLVIKDNKIKGVIDFDLFQIAPLMQDIAICIQLYCLTDECQWDDRKVRTLLNEYTRFRQISDRESAYLQDLIARECYGAIIFFYLRMKKYPERRYRLIDWSLKIIKNIWKESQGDSQISY